MNIKNLTAFSRTLLLVGVIALSVLITVPSEAFAASIPQIMSYQGRLTDSSDNLLGGSGTTYYFKFSLWDNPTVGDGSRLWPTGAPGVFQTTVAHGVFTANIGDTVNGFPDALNYAFSNPDVYLQVDVSADGSSYETLSPRQQITSAAFADVASVANTVNGSGNSVLGNATSTNFYSTTASSTNLFAMAFSGGSITANSFSGAGLTTCNNASSALIWSNGVFGCNSISGGGGGGSDVNWDFFNDSGIRVSTTTNQVLIGAASTSTLSQLEVHGGAFIDNATTTNATSTNLYIKNLFGINNNYFSNLLGSGLSDSAGALTVSGLTTSNLASANISQFTNDANYLTGNQTVTLSGDVSGSGGTAITTTIGANRVTNSMLAGSIAASKLVGTDISTVGTITSGAWNGSPISPTYGGTGQNLSSANGILNFYNGAAGTIATSSLGLLTTNVAEGTNLYYTQARFDTALAATTTLNNLSVLKGLTDLIATRATTTSATSTNFFATTASATNLFFTNATGNLTGNITGSAPAGSLTGATLASNVLASSLTSIGTLASGAVPASLITAGTFGTGNYIFPGQLQINSSTTLQNFTGLNSTTTNATSTNIFAASGTFTNLFSTNANLGTLSLSSALSAANGGTGLNSILNNQLLIGGAGNSVTQIATSSLGLLTTNVAEGTNLYYTNPRVQSYLDTLDKGYFFSTTSAAYWQSADNFYSTTSADYWLTQKTTSNLAEGANLYYTQARFDATLAATTTLNNITTLKGLAGLTTSNLASANISQFTNDANYLTGNQTITLSGDISGSGATSISAILATVNSNAGSFGGVNSIPSFTVNGKGLITAASANTPSIPASEITNGTFGTGNYIFPAQLQINSSTTLQNFTALNSTSTNATTTNFFATTASSSNLFAASANVGTLTVGNCIGCSSGGIANLGPAGQTQSGSVVTLATSSSPFNGLTASTTITALSNTISFANTLSGLLGAGGGGTGISNPTAAGVLLGSYAGGGYQQIATTSLGLLTTNVAEGTNLYYTQARFDAALAATTTLSNLTNLKGLTNLIAANSTSTNATTTNTNISGSLGLNGSYFSNLLGSGLSDSAGALTVSGLTTSNLASANISQFTNDANYLTGNQTVTLSGDVSGSGATSISAILATVNSNAGSFGGVNSIPTFTVNGKGLITAAGSATPSIPASEITNGTFGTGNYIFPAQLQINSSTTLQNFTGLNSTSTNATTTGALNVGTTLTATGGLSTFSNALHTGSTTLQNFTFINATGTSATTTNFFATTASTTNLFFTTATGNLTGNITGSAPAGNLTGTVLASNVVSSSLTSIGTLSAGAVPASLITAGTFGTGNYIFPAQLQINSSTTLQNFTSLNATTTNATTTGALSVGTTLTATGGLSTFSNALHTGSTTLQNFTALNSTSTNATTTNAFSVGGNLTVSLLSQLANLLVTGSSTLQNFTASNSTSTSATSTNFFATSGTFTNLFANLTGNVTGNVTGNITGSAPSGSLTGTTLASNVVTSSLTSIGTLSAGAVPASLITSGTFGAGNYIFPAQLQINSSTTLQNFTALNSTSTNATTTGALSVGGNFVASLLSQLTNLLVTGSSTLQNFTASNSTSTSATSTNFFATTASSTQDFSAFYTGGNLRINASSTLQNFTFGNATGTNATTTSFFTTTASTTNLFFTTATGNLTGNITGSAPAGNLTGTVLASNVVSSSLTSIGTLSAGAVPASLITAGTFGTGNYIFPAQLQINSSTTLQNFTGLNSTTTNATSTGALSVGTTLTATGGLSTFSNALHTGSTTLQNFTFINATGTSATTTNFFSTTASSTNLFSTSFSGAGLSTCNTAGSSALTWTGGVFGCNSISSTGGSPFPFTTVSTWVSTSTIVEFTKGILTNGTSTIGDSTQGGGLTINGGATTTGQFLELASTTLQNFTALNSTSTNATTTTIFATTASSTNLFSTSLTTGLVTSGLINSQTISSVANFTGSITMAAASAFAFNGRSSFQAPSDGVLELTNNAQTGFTRLQFGGTTSSFPSLKVNGSGLQFRLADDSGDASTSAFTMNLNGDASTSAASAGSHTLSNKPILQLGSTALSNGSTYYSANGTYIGVNAPSTFTGNIINMQENGTDLFTIDHYGDLITGNITGNNVNVGQNYYLGFTNGAGNATFLQSPAVDQLEISNNSNSTSRLQFDGTTSAYPALKRNGTGLQFRLADDSAFASTTALSEQLAGDASSTASATSVTNPTLQLGSTALVSPSTSGTYLAIDAPSTFNGNYIDLQGGQHGEFTMDAYKNISTGGSFLSTSSVGGASLYATAGNIDYFSSTQLLNSTDGQLELTNHAGTGFTNLQFGGTTSAFPELKVNGTGLQFELADGSGLASSSASTFGIGTTTQQTQLSIATTTTMSSLWPTVDIGPSQLFNGASGGTILGGNMQAGWTGDYINFETAGGDQFEVQATGSGNSGVVVDANSFQAASNGSFEYNGELTLQPDDNIQALRLVGQGGCGCTSGGIEFGSNNTAPALLVNGTELDFKLADGSAYSNFRAANSTTTNSTSTNFFSTNGAFTNLTVSSCTGCGSGSQTPWTGNINGGGYSMTNVLGLITNASSTIGNGLLGGGLTINGGATSTNLMVLASSTLQNLTFINATGTSATTTNFYSNAIDTPSFSANSTGATSTNIYISGVASTTNFYGAGLPGSGCSGSDELQWSAGKFSCVQGGGIQSQTYTNATVNGTWTKPAGAILVIIQAIGGGGGGGGGGSTNGALTPHMGGSGGGGGAFNTGTFNASDLGATENYNVGAGGTAGAGGAQGAVGKVGGQGTTTSFGTIVKVFAGGGGGGALGGITAVVGGGGGGGGTASSTSGASLGNGAAGNTSAGVAGLGSNLVAGTITSATIAGGQQAGGLGGVAATQGGVADWGGGGGGGHTNVPGNGGPGGTSIHGGGGGGGGGGETATPALTNAAAGGASGSLIAAGGGGGAAGTSGASPTAGSQGANGGTTLSGAGGGGGGSTLTNGVAGQAGGQGGAPGGAGGGGGTASSTTSETGGNGGAGATGQLVVWTIEGTGSDLAEVYSTNDPSIGPGDVVALDPSLNAGVQKTSEAYDPGTIGIISTTPSLVMGSIDDPNAVGVVDVALAGRVPVKVNTENGPIKAGDLLTPSSEPGVAMKATKAGVIIGEAMIGFPNDSTIGPLTADDSGADQEGEIVAFVKTSYGNGTALSDLIPGLTSGTGTSTDSQASTTPTYSDIGKQALLYMVSNVGPLASSTDLSEISTDRLTAGLEIITPRVIAQEVDADSILPSLTNNVTVDLSGNASSTLVIKGASGNAVSFDNLGDATFDGGLTVDSASIFNGGLKTDSIGSIGDVLSLANDVSFVGRPYFNGDTAGGAIVKTGDSSVEVTFARDYDAPPVTSAAISLDAASTSPDAENLIFSDDIQYIITRRSVHGFTILLNKPAPEDITFSWTAFAPQGGTLFTSVDASPDQESVEQTPLSSDAPIVPLSVATTTPISTDDASTSTDATTTLSDETASTTASSDADAADDLPTSTPPDIAPATTSTPLDVSSTTSPDASAPDPSDASTASSTSSSGT